MNIYLCRFVKIMKHLQIILFFLLTYSTVFSQVDVCEFRVIEDERDFPENIPGETMGQKLESLLFWSQEERERRFAMMQSIFPSIEVPASSTVFELKNSKSPIDLEEKFDVDYYLEKNHIQGLIVLQNDEIKLEVYSDGMDEHTLWTSFSVAKSVASMLVGTALKDGIIKSMEDELEIYIPELKDTDYGKVTVRQLLTMTSGIDWNEDYSDPNSDVAQMYQLPCENNEAHILTYMKNLKQIHEPGKHWNYSTGETDLVGILIQKASGKSLAEYLSEKIWKPFGMQQCAFWLADECSNLNIGGSGLSASLRDFARLGLLMLKDGEINGESIFSDEWLENATRNLYQTNDSGGGYGYLWWRNPDGSYTANGIFGQFIYINPERNLVIAQSAAWPLAGSRELSKNRNEFVNAVLKALDN